MAAAKPKLIRNLTHVTVQLRFGSKKDPYHVKLNPRGTRGDVQQVPADLKDHPAFLANQGSTFELITAKQAEKAAEDYAPGGIQRPREFENLKVTIERDRDTSVTVAKLDISDSGFITESNRYRGPIRNPNRPGLEPERAELPGTEDGPDLGDARKMPAARNKPRVKQTGAEGPGTELPTFGGLER